MKKQYLTAQEVAEVCGVSDGKAYGLIREMNAELKAAGYLTVSGKVPVEQAEWAVENGHYDHIGYVFADQNIVGIDIDAGFEDGLMTPLCADIMQACHSYTEKSRSGRGVHILMRGKLPFSGKNNLAGVEIYQARRFFIMTGKVLIFPEIIDNQEAIDYVVEKYFKETEKTGSNSNMVQRIYSPKFPKPTGGRIFVRPDYPEIPDGGRNISLTRKMLLYKHRLQKQVVILPILQ